MPSWQLKMGGTIGPLGMVGQEMSWAISQHRSHSTAPLLGTFSTTWFCPCRVGLIPPFWIGVLWLILARWPCSTIQSQRLERGELKYTLVALVQRHPGWSINHGVLIRGRHSSNSHNLILRYFNGTIPLHRLGIQSWKIHSCTMALLSRYHLQEVMCKCWVNDLESQFFLVEFPWETPSNYQVTLPSFNLLCLIDLLTMVASLIYPSSASSFTQKKLSIQASPAHWVLHLPRLSALDDPSASTGKISHRWCAEVLCRRSGTCLI